MSVVSDLRTVLVNRIEALSSVEVAYPYEHPSPKGFPAVFVTSSSMNSEFTSNVENRRTFIFDIVVIYPTGQNLPKDNSQNPVQRAEDAIYEVFDQISSDLDENAFENDFAELSDSNSEYLYAGASDAEWGFFTYEGGEARALRIPLTIIVDFRARGS